MNSGMRPPNSGALWPRPAERCLNRRGSAVAKSFRGVYKLRTFPSEGEAEPVGAGRSRRSKRNGPREDPEAASTQYAPSRGVRRVTQETARQGLKGKGPAR